MSYNKRCTTCKESKSIDNFCKDSKRSDGYDTQCKKCRAIRKKETRVKIKNLIRSKKNAAGCCFCGYNRHHSALDFHHTDDNKGFNISSMADHDSYGKIEREVSKCILVCRNCHAEIHAGLISKKEVDKVIVKQGVFSLSGQLYLRF